MKEQQKAIPIKKIISIDNPGDYKLHAARYNNEYKPLDVYVNDKNKWLDWNRWQRNNDEFNQQYLFTLMDFYPEKHIWLFGGIYKILANTKEPMAHSYTIKELEEYSAYVGRLKIKLENVPRRGRAFLLENHIDKMEVSEILKKPYSGEVFPGYEDIDHGFNLLLPIFKNENADWKGALENVKGVYVIMDKTNGKKYIGAAYGDGGIWSRWADYMNTGHGGNDDLTELIEKEGLEYAKDNFKLSLLEYRSMKTDDGVIQNREKYWKKVFLSQEKNFGYNQN